MSNPPSFTLRMLWSRITDETCSKDSACSVVASAMGLGLAFLVMPPQRTGLGEGARRSDQRLSETHTDFTWV